MSIAALGLGPRGSVGAAQRSTGRVVAVGDIHGDADAFAGILQSAGVIDEQRRWIGGRTTLVQTGDFTDRGPQVRDVMDLLMSLEKQAAAAGGRVLALLGNHEAMNIMGEVRDATPAIFASFADGESEARRETAYQTYLQVMETRRATSEGAAPTVQMKEQWLAAHPPGFVEYRAAFGPDGTYGRWLRQKPIVARMGDTIFLHGGLRPDLDLSVDQINDRMRRELTAFDRYQRHLIERRLVPPFFTLQELLNTARRELERVAAQAAAEHGDGAVDRDHVAVLEGLMQAGSWLALNPESPLWFRGYATWTSEEGAAHMDAVLKRHRAARIVVGHTILGSFRITPRFSARVFLIDTGMLSSYYRGGRASALDLQDGRITAIYPGERMALEPRPE